MRQTTGTRKSPGELPLRPLHKPRCRQGRTSHSRALAFFQASDLDDVCRNRPDTNSEWRASLSLLSRQTALSNRARSR